jgi:hypothetical protein
MNSVMANYPYALYITRRNVHRLCATALTIAMKVLIDGGQANDDHLYTMTRIAEIAGISRQELVQLERELVLCVQWDKLFVNDEAELARFELAVLDFV